MTSKPGKTMKSGSAAEFSLDPSIYSAEAVKLAAFVFSDRAEISVRPGKKSVSVSFRAAAGGTQPGEFLNEVLNQQCRIDLARTNSRIAGIIVTKALLSAAGEK